jgi:hypothetical protein
VTTENTIQPIVGPDGEVIPGLFAFPSLERNSKVEHDIVIFELEQARLRRLQEIENSKIK